MKGFNPLRFFILTIFIGGLTLLSFLTAFGKDEGTLYDNFFLNFMANTFYIFRFPTHVLFWKYMSGSSFFFGLLLNTLFYAGVIEATIIILKKRK